MNRRHIGESVFVLAVCFGYFILRSAYALAIGQHELVRSTRHVAGGLAFEVLIGVLVLLFLRQRGRDLAPLRPRVTWDGVLIGALLGVVMAGFLGVVTTALMKVVPAVRDAGLQQYRWLANGWLTASFLVVNSWFEETFVNAYVVNAFADARPGLLIAGSALLRASYHLYEGPAAAGAIFTLGLVFAAVYWRGRNLTPLIVAHTVCNVVAVALHSR